MKRKVIQLAGKTLVVSLPSKWARQNNVKKGQEVDVEEKGHDLLIKTQSVPEEMKKSFDAKGISERVFRWSLSSLHKQGYDEIEVLFDNPKVLEWLDDLVKNLFIGFVIVDQSGKRCLVRRISQEMDKEFDTALRRAFLVTISLGESMIELYKKKERVRFAELVSLEKTNNQLTNFCERILNKMGHPDPKKTCFYYAIVWNTEKICDDLKYFCKYISLSKNKKIRFSADVLTFLEHAIKFFKDFYAIVYKFDFRQLEALNEERKRFLREKEKYLKAKTPEEIVLLDYLLSFIIKIDEYSASMIAVKME
ncbi:MAG: AbrB/MazE/SpoVT family DNA-binding domain-containing protein [Nanoarchaeota archaeon]